MAAHVARWARRTTVSGGLLWLGLVAGGELGALQRLDRIERIVLLAVLLVVPALLALREDRGALLELARGVHGFAAPLVALAFYLPVGPGSALATVPWLALTALLALHAASGLRRGLGPGELAHAAALLYLPVGGGWLLLSRLGVRPLGFSEPIVLLTAMHFHYAAFAALSLTALAGRAGLDRLPAYRAIAWTLILAPAVVAVGITESPLLEVVGACATALALGTVAVLQLVAVRPPRGRGWLVASSLSVLASMGFAVSYAVGELTGEALVGIERMVVVHGGLNAYGFALLGALAWTQAARRTTPH